MSLELQKNLENKEEIILRIIVLRHGPKLSAAGEKSAKAAYFDDSVRQGFGKTGLGEGEGLARTATSSVQRAVDTARITQEEIDATDHRSDEYIKKDKKLEVPFQPKGDAEDDRYARDLDRIISLQKELEPLAREEIAKESPELEGDAREAAVRNRMDMTVLGEMFEEEKNPLPARRFETSYQELADNFAKRYLGFARHAGFLKNRRELSEMQPQNEPYVQIDVTHSFPAMAFLKKYLVFENGDQTENMSSKDFFEKTGGIIRESGFFQMDFIDSNPPKIQVSGEFEPGKKFQGIINLSGDQYVKEKE